MQKYFQKLLTQIKSKPQMKDFQQTMNSNLRRGKQQMRKSAQKIQQYLKSKQTFLSNNYKKGQYSKSFTEFFQNNIRPTFLLILNSLTKLNLSKKINNLFTKLNLRPQKFTNSIQRNIQKFLEFLSQFNLNIPKFLVLANTFCYSMYLFWPSRTKINFYKHFSYVNSNIQHLHLHTCLTSHFSHDSMIAYLIDSIILYLLANNVMLMRGPIYLGTLCLMSIIIGTGLLALKMSMTQFARPYLGNDAILRGLIFSIVFAQPQSKFYLFPLPFTIPAWVIAAVCIFLDFITLNAAGFGGMIASHLLLKV